MRRSACQLDDQQDRWQIINDVLTKAQLAGPVAPNAATLCTLAQSVQVKQLALLVHLQRCLSLSYRCRSTRKGACRASSH